MNNGQNFNSFITIPFKFYYILQVFVILLLLLSQSDKGTFQIAKAILKN